MICVKLADRELVVLLDVLEVPVQENRPFKGATKLMKRSEQSMHASEHHGNGGYKHTV